MTEMTDTEFIQAIKDRLMKYGWDTGRIGTFEGPNCIVGAAGFVQHGESLKVDKTGVSPLAVEGNPLVEEGNYDEIPGMVRLAKLLGEEDLFSVSSGYNDRCDTLDQVFEKVDSRIAELERFQKLLGRYGRPPGPLVRI